MKNIIDIISNGEGLTVEFKKSREKVTSDVYQSICAFLNRNGGQVFLGVEDDGTITGIKEDAVEQMKKDLVTALNNPQKINPPLYILPEEIKLNGKILLLLDIPESSQVHRCNNRIYDRNEDGDFNITDNTNLVAELYIRKQSSYSENRIYPYVTLEDLRIDLIQRVRKLARGQRPAHGIYGKAFAGQVLPDRRPAS
jgi:ATP-dependent DNA helicase RecG